MALVSIGSAAAGAWMASPPAAYAATAKECTSFHTADFKEFNAQHTGGEEASPGGMPELDIWVAHAFHAA